MEKIEGEDPAVFKAKISLAVAKDLMLRAPLFAIVVVILMGGMTYFFVWFTLNVIKPYMLGE